MDVNTILCIGRQNVYDVLTEQETGLDICVNDNVNTMNCDKNDFADDHRTSRTTMGGLGSPATKSILRSKSQSVRHGSPSNFRNVRFSNKDSVEGNASVFSKLHVNEAVQTDDRKEAHIKERIEDKLNESWHEHLKSLENGTNRRLEFSLADPHKVNNESNISHLKYQRFKGDKQDSFNSKLNVSNYARLNARKSEYVDETPPENPHKQLSSKPHLHTNSVSLTQTPWANAASAARPVLTVLKGAPMPTTLYEYKTPALSDAEHKEANFSQYCWKPQEIAQTSTPRYTNPKEVPVDEVGNLREDRAASPIVPYCAMTESYDNSIKHGGKSNLSRNSEHVSHGLQNVEKSNKTNDSRYKTDTHCNGYYAKQLLTGNKELLPENAKLLPGNKKQTDSWNGSLCSVTSDRSVKSDRSVQGDKNKNKGLLLSSGDKVYLSKPSASIATQTEESTKSTAPDANKIIKNWEFSKPGEIVDKDNAVAISVGLQTENCKQIDNGMQKVKKLPDGNCIVKNMELFCLNPKMKSSYSQTINLETERQLMSKVDLDMDPGNGRQKSVFVQTVDQRQKSTFVHTLDKKSLNCSLRSDNSDDTSQFRSFQTQTDFEENFSTVDLITRHGYSSSVAVQTADPQKPDGNRIIQNIEIKKHSLCITDIPNAARSDWKEFVGEVADASSVMSNFDSDEEEYEKLKKSTDVVFVYNKNAPEPQEANYTRRGYEISEEKLSEHNAMSLLQGEQWAKRRWQEVLKDDDTSNVRLNSEYKSKLLNNLSDRGFPQEKLSTHSVTDNKEATVKTYVSSYHGPEIANKNSAELSYAASRNSDTLKLESSKIERLTMDRKNNFSKLEQDNRANLDLRKPREHTTAFRSSQHEYNDMPERVTDLRTFNHNDNNVEHRLAFASIETHSFNPNTLINNKFKMEGVEVPLKRFPVSTTQSHPQLSKSPPQCKSTEGAMKCNFSQRLDRGSVQKDNLNVSEDNILHERFVRPIQLGSYPRTLKLSREQMSDAQISDSEIKIDPLTKSSSTSNSPISSKPRIRFVCRPNPSFSPAVCVNKSIRARKYKTVGGNATHLLYTPCPDYESFVLQRQATRNRNLHSKPSAQVNTEEKSVHQNRDIGTRRVYSLSPESSISSVSYSEVLHDTSNDRPTIKEIRSLQKTHSSNFSTDAASFCKTSAEAANSVKEIVERIGDNNRQSGSMIENEHFVNGSKVSSDLFFGYAYNKHRDEINKLVSGKPPLPGKVESTKPAQSSVRNIDISKERSTKATIQHISPPLRRNSFNEKSTNTVPNSKGTAHIIGDRQQDHLSTYTVYHSSQGIEHTHNNKSQQHAKDTRENGTIGNAPAGIIGGKQDLLSTNTVCHSNQGSEHMHNNKGQQHAKDTREKVTIGNAPSISGHVGTNCEFLDHDAIQRIIEEARL